MSGLTIFSDTAPQQPLWQSRDAQEIQRQLAQIGVRFERWQADRELGDNPQPEVVIAAYQHEIDRLVAEKGYQSWDVISMRPDHEQRQTLREKFLSEHTHGEDEVRFSSKAQGCFACIWTARSSRSCAKERSDLGAGQHPALVRYGIGPAFHRDPGVRQPGRLGGAFHRRQDRR